MPLYTMVEDIHHSAKENYILYYGSITQNNLCFVTPQTITYLSLGFDDSNTEGRRRATNASYNSSTQLHSTRTRRNKNKLNSDNLLVAFSTTKKLCSQISMLCSFSCTAFYGSTKAFIPEKSTALYIVIQAQQA